MRRLTAATPKRDHGHLRMEDGIGRGAREGRRTRAHSAPPGSQGKHKKGEAGEDVTFCSPPFNRTSTQCPVLGGIHGEEIASFFGVGTQAGIERAHVQLGGRAIKVGRHGPVGRGLCTGLFGVPDALIGSRWGDWSRLTTQRRRRWPFAGYRAHRVECSRLRRERGDSPMVQRAAGGVALPPDFLVLICGRRQQAIKSGSPSCVCMNETAAGPSLCELPSAHREIAPSPCQWNATVPRLQRVAFYHEKARQAAQYRPAAN